jgi:hypothetical protein
LDVIANRIPESVQLLTSSVEGVLAILVKGVEMDLGPIEVHHPRSWRSFVRTWFELLRELGQGPEGLPYSILYFAAVHRREVTGGPVMGSGTSSMLLW